MRARILTAAVLIPISLAAITRTDPWPITVFGFILALIGSDEIHRLLKADEVWKKTGTQFPSAMLPAVLPVAPILTLALPNFAVQTVEIGIGLFLAGIAAAWFGVRMDPGFLKIPLVLASGLWIGGPIFCLIGIHNLLPTQAIWNFHTPVSLAVMPLWAGDIAAIFVGRAYGRHPLAPTISPNKTWEGAITNLVACIATGALLGPWCNVGLTVGIACGVVAGIFGQLGDLFESCIKRSAGQKDSGSLLPGHGGLMDRMDSILFTAPFVALILLSSWR
jgi:phosphatidate cytidylyltransferase